MRRFRKILVHVSVEGNDAAGELAVEVGRMSEAQEVRYLHTMPPFELPSGLRERFPSEEEFMRKAEEDFRSRMGRHAGAGALPMTQKAVVGTTVDTLLLESLEMECDLMIVGSHGENSFLAEKMVRKAPCSVLVVPEGARTSFSGILVGVDFSGHSDLAMEFAMAFAIASGCGKLHLANVASLPFGHGRSLIAEEDFHRMLVEDAERKMEQKIALMEHGGIELVGEVLFDQVPALALATHAKALGVDLLAVGCRGKDALSSLLLGSNSQEIIRNSEIPVLAVKAKGTGVSLLDALLGRS